MCDMKYLNQMLKRYEKTIFGKALPIKFIEGQSTTDGETIYIRKPSPMTIKEVRRSYSGVIHENFHVLFGSVELFKQLKEMNVSPKFRYMFNTIEDYRVETLGEFEFPGAGHYLKEIMQQRIDDHDIIINNIYIKLLCELHNYNYESYGWESYDIERATEIASISVLLPKEHMFEITKRVCITLEEKDD